VILDGFPDAEISVSIVWIPMLEGDTEAVARERAVAFANDPRGRQFYDAEKRLGRHVAQLLAGGADAVAWDAYLFFAAGSKWRQSLPRPAAWTHQLTTSNWAAARNYQAGEALEEELRRAMGELIATEGTG
jgi:hypothetical protein